MTRGSNRGAAQEATALPLDGRAAGILAPSYRKFRVTERILLTGHSHQAWPDVAFDGLARSWEDAAELADEKWEAAFRADRAVRRGYRKLLDDADGEIALGQNTHELLLRLLSALPLRDRPRIVATDGEFRSAERQLARLEEEGIQVTRVPVRRGRSLAERISLEVTDSTALVLVSSVMYADALIVRDLDHVARACARCGAELLVDAYHSLGAVPFSVAGMGLQDAFVTGGGYKYLQLGEGNAFLRIPPGRRMRPIITGWFAEFGQLEGGGDAARKRVRYPAGRGQFEGATYDPASRYRARAVFEFFRRRGLKPDWLRANSLRQLRIIARRLDELDPDGTALGRDRTRRFRDRGGFMPLRAPRAASLATALRKEGVFADARGSTLRLGPAPYVSDDQLDEAVERLVRLAGGKRLR